VWKEPELSLKATTVRFDGKLTLPMVGDVSAAGRTPQELARELEVTLKRFIEVPQVTVAVTEARSARYFVLGKVGQQGAFPYLGPIRLVQALALAGGFQEFAKRDRVLVIRETNGKQSVLRVDYGRLESDGNVEANVLLLPGDTVVVP
jgi:polysaccharide export outer membrane protein